MRVDLDAMKACLESVESLLDMLLSETQFSSGCCCLYRWYKFGIPDPPPLGL